MDVTDLGFLPVDVEGSFLIISLMILYFSSYGLQIEICTFLAYQNSW
jgi:hypothetical protein